MGGFGNHIRWLCLLDNKFNLSSFVEMNVSLPDDKVKFILKHVYPDYRTWQTWLHFEWMYRNSANSLIYFDHSFNRRAEQILFVNSNAELCLRHYIKFNSQLNGVSISNFMVDINEYLTDMKKHNFFTVDGALFFADTLPKFEYNKIINYFNLEDNYVEANKIHQQWFKLNQSAENEIGNWYRDFYSS